MRHYSRAEMAQVYDHVLGDLLPGRGPQAPYTASVLQRYRVGSRLQLAGSVFHYCQAEAVTGFGIQVGSRGASNFAEHFWEVYAVVGITPVGSHTVVVADGVHGLNFWENGLLQPSLPLGTSIATQRKIRSSTATVGGNVTLTLYQPLTQALANAQGTYLSRNIYADVGQIQGSVPARRTSIVCLPEMGAIAAGSFFWGLTWGLCMPTATVGDMGGVDNMRQVYFNHNDGSVRDGSQGAVFGDQHAGYLLPYTPTGLGAIIMLQLDP